MRRPIVGLVLLASAALAAAAPPEGRWRGAVHIPGRELDVVVDLAPDAAGAWTGSLIVPGTGIKGAPLAHITVGESDVAFDAADALRAPDGAPATFSARIGASGVMSGRFTQGGNVAAFDLRRIGPAQVETPPAGTPVRAELESEWAGEFELGGYPRRVTIGFANHGGSAATATFVIVGKRTNELPVDLVTDEGDFVRVDSHATRVAFEGRYVADAHEIRGTIELAGLELPLVLRRSPAKAR